MLCLPFTQCVSTREEPVFNIRNQIVVMKETEQQNLTRKQTNK